MQWRRHATSGATGAHRAPTATRLRGASKRGLGVVGTQSAITVGGPSRDATEIGHNALVHQRVWSRPGNTPTG